MALHFSYPANWRPVKAPPAYSISGRRPALRAAIGLFPNSSITVTDIGVIGQLVTPGSSAVKSALQRSNRLLGAVTRRPMHGSVHVVHGLVELTYPWGRSTASGPALKASYTNVYIADTEYEVECMAKSRYLKLGQRACAQVLATINGRASAASG